MGSKGLGGFFTAALKPKAVATGNFKNIDNLVKGKTDKQAGAAAAVAASDEPVLNAQADNNNSGGFVVDAVGKRQSLLGN